MHVPSRQWGTEEGLVFAAPLALGFGITEVTSTRLLHHAEGLPWQTFPRS